MKKFTLNTLLRHRYFMAALGGLLLSTAFSPLAWAGTAWLALGWMLFAGLGCTPGRAFRVGFVGGLAHFLSSLYWLLAMPFAWHGLPLAPALGWILLSAYCALYPGLWVWACWKIFPAANLDEFAAASWLRRMAWAFTAAAIWTALEYMRGLFLTGFPWNFVGASQYQMLPLIQIASVTGIYGVSFLVAWTSVSLFAAVATLRQKPNGLGLWTSAGPALLVVVIAGSWGASRLMSARPPTRELSVAMIQPSIPQTLIFDPAADQSRFQTVLDLSRQALASHAQLLLWPESAVPDLTPEIQQTIGQLVQSYKTWLLFISGTVEPAENNPNAYFCSALLCDPQGGLQGIYHKRHLVIFGEYIPLVKWLPFLKWFSPVGDGMVPGDRAVNFETENPPARFSALICFEDMFAQEAREHVGPDTDFLVNLTNDGWFGHGPEQWQQAASGIFRAVENGVPLLRCTNDGLTCWADGFGRLRQIYRSHGSVYDQGFMNIKVPLRSPGDHSRTIYNQYGDWFPALCTGISLAGLSGSVWRRARKKS